MRSYIRYPSIAVLISIFGLAISASPKANPYYDSATLQTFPAPNNQVNYIIKGYLKGESKGILESGVVTSRTEALARKKTLMQKYQIPESPYVIFPLEKDAFDSKPSTRNFRK